MTTMSSLNSSNPAILLVSMPFGPLYTPSLGLSLLAGQLQKDNIPVQIRYFNVDFAKIIGQDLYTSIAEGSPSTIALSGEWIFSHCLFHQKADDANDYIRNVLRKEYAANISLNISFSDLVSGIFEARSLAQSFIQRAVQEIVESDASIVGFTSVFQQHLASLAAARILKKIRPDSCIVFGGANCEGEMGQEILKQFCFIDELVSGEGELAFQRIVKNKLESATTNGEVQKVSTADNPQKLVLLGEDSVHIGPIKMDDLPWPDYEDFFYQVGQSGIDQARIRLLFESSRGCWWGEKHHCTFCGLNGSTMTFRSKSPGRCLQELTGLYEKYGINKFSAADNIMDPRHLDTFFPSLAAAQLPVELFYEIKANLKKDHLRVLRDAGVTSLQPGIESLDSEVLAQMNKGITALQNIQTLKWCKEFGISVAWNILWGFPYEKSQAYRDMTVALPKYEHLPAPLGVRKIRMDRFSPNYIRGAELGFNGIRAASAYTYLYPFENEVLDHLAYYFEADTDSNPDVEYEVGLLERSVNDWIVKQPSSDLVAVDKEGELIVVDVRSTAKQTLRRIVGLDRAILLFCDTIHSLNALTKFTGEQGFCADKSAVCQAVNRLADADLVVVEGEQVLSLPILAETYTPNVRVLERIMAARYK